MHISTLAPDLIQRHIVRPRGVMAFEVLGTKVSHALENLFYGNYKKKGHAQGNHLSSPQGPHKKEFSLLSPEAKGVGGTFY